MKTALYAVTLVLFILNEIIANPIEGGEEAAKTFMADAEEQMRKASEEVTYAAWNRDTNITDELVQKAKDVTKVGRDLNLKIGKEAEKFNLADIQDPDLLRKLKWVKDLDFQALPEDKIKRYNEIIAEIENVYITARVPGFADPNILLPLEPDLTFIFAQSRDMKELEYYWTQWRNVTGAKIRSLYQEILDITNEAAKLNGFDSAVELKTYAYESDSFPEKIKTAWQGLKPLYDQLHAYVRSKIIERFGSESIKQDSPIPSHLLGTMWGTNWENLLSLLLPYPEKRNFDVTLEMNKLEWTPKIMFEKAQDYFVSLGFDPLPQEFWNGSIIEKPSDDRRFNCKAGSWDFYNGKDFRMKQCTQVNVLDLLSIYYEMTRVYNYIGYSGNSFLYRNGASPGFRRGLASMVSLSAGTPQNLKTIGLLNDTVDIDDKDIEINTLLSQAIQKLVFMPVAYLTDKYRWDLYRDKISRANMNCEWVKLIVEIQGLAPPNKRSESQFDAGSHFSIASEETFTSLLTSNYYQYIFLKHFCTAAGQYVPGDVSKPLHKCSLYGNKEAGKQIQDLMRIGRSKTIVQVLQDLTGKPFVDPEPFREYFAPLEEWLKKYNEEKNNNVGWKVDDIGQFCSA